LIYELDRIKTKVPVFIDSPLGLKITKIYSTLEDPTNDIFFVGYQAKGTPGRKMIEKQTPVKAGIHTLTGYSAHADQKTLVNWVRSMPEPPKQIHLVHGESHARHALSKALEQHTAMQDIFKCMLNL
jgi:predicted metal-dependent RNase